MTIEKIACPRLNGVSSTGSNSSKSVSEVFVSFDGLGNPHDIMCDSYNQAKKAIKICSKTDNLPCIYSKWEKL